MKPFPALTPTLRNHATRLFNVHIHAFIVHIPWRSPRLCERPSSRGIFFLAKPLRALRHAYPCAALAFSATLRETFFPRDISSRQAAKGAKACILSAQPWRSPRLCESLISRGIFFLAKPLRALRHAYPCAALAFSATLRETFFPRDISSRQAAKGAKACILSAQPWRSPRLCESLISRGIFFSPSRKGR